MIALNVTMGKHRQLLELLHVMNAQQELILWEHLVHYVQQVRVRMLVLPFVYNAHQGNSLEKVAKLANLVAQHDGCSLLVRPVTRLNEIFQGHASGGSMEIAS